MGCGIGYGYLHRIPIRVLPDDKAGAAAGTYTATTAAPLSVPYVPPLANTFASTNVNTVPMVPNTGKSDAEIVFGGVANLNISTNTATTTMPAEQQQQQQLPPTLPPTSQHQQQPSNETIVPTTHTQSIELAANVSMGQQPNVSAPPPATYAPPPPQQQQQPSIFGTVPPTSIPSLNESFNIGLNESFNIPPTTINPSSVPPPPSSMYQTNPTQGKMMKL